MPENNQVRFYARLSFFISPSLAENRNAVFKRQLLTHQYAILNTNRADLALLVAHVKHQLKRGF